MTPSSSAGRAKVLLVGDSLALPGHGSLYEDTWPHLLRSAHPEWEVITVLRRGATTSVLAREGGGGDAPPGADTLEHYCPDAAVLQLGIVDCAPRLFSPLEQKLMRTMPRRLSRLYLAAGTRLRSRKAWRAYLTAQEFGGNLAAYLERSQQAGVRAVVFVAIAPGGTAMRAKNREAGRAAALYNGAATEVFSAARGALLVDPLAGCGDDYYCSDGYHLSPLGHAAVFRAVEEGLQRCLA